MRALRAVVRWFLRLGCIGGWTVLLVGGLLHLTVRDGIGALEIVYYALPLPVLLAISIGLGLIESVHRKRRLGAAGLSLLIGGFWLSSSFRWHSENDVPNPDLKVLIWNLARPDAPSEALVKILREHQPDIASIVEPGKQVGNHIAWYEERLPDYKIVWMPRGILWFSKLPSRYRSRGKLDSIGAYAWFDVEHPKGSFRFVSIDVYPLPLKSRRQQLAEALDWTGELSHAMVGGDFNTPLGSVHFDPFRAQLTNAFSEAGRGFDETWFWGVPLLALDQLWIGSDWKTLTAKKIHTRASDHAALLASFERIVPRSTAQ